MIDDTLGRRGQLHLIYDQPLRLVEKGKSGVSGSTKAVKRDNSNVLPTQPSSSHPKTAPDPHFFNREGVRSSKVPSSSTSATGWPALTPVPKKRPSDTPDTAMKRQKTGKYPGCLICGGPHHLVKDCPVTAEGPKRYCFPVSNFMSSLLITSWIVYALQSPDWNLNQGKLPLSLLSVTF